jgi:hypothetical protein
MSGHKLFGRTYPAPRVAFRSTILGCGVNSHNNLLALRARKLCAH